MKRLYIYILLFSFVVIGICGYLLYYVSFVAVVTGSVSKGIDKTTVVIDAGHGGADSGAVGADGTQEKTINLEIALKLENELTGRGVKCIMTRTADDSIHSPSAETIREKKVSDIHNRLKIMTQTENCIFVSIHQNSYTSAKYSGAQVFYAPNSADSRQLAQTIQHSIITELQPDNTRVIKECGSSVYLIYNAVKPAVLVECGFMTNSAELEKLKTSDYQLKMAESIADGIIEYLEGS